jgi:hypothetical protein
LRNQAVISTESYICQSNFLAFSRNSDEPNEAKMFSPLLKKYKIINKFGNIYDKNKGADYAKKIKFEILVKGGSAEEL